MNEDGYSNPYYLSGEIQRQSSKENSTNKNFLSEESRHLLKVAGLPLLDGYFLAFLVGSMWIDLWHCVVFGLTAFSGAASILTAMKMNGKISRRILEVCWVYIIICASALAITAFRETMISLTPENIKVFTALFLFGLGLQITGNGLLGKVAYEIGSRSVVGAIFAFMIYNGVTQAANNELYLVPSFNLDYTLPVLIAVISGFTLTLIGVFIGYKFKHVVDGTPMKYGAGIALVIMALSVLGFEIPSYLALFPIAIGAFITLTKNNATGESKLKQV